jgi:uncharacterized cupin superfamily protein
LIYHSVDNPSEFEHFPIPEVSEGRPDAQVHWLRKEGSDGTTLMTGVFTAKPSRFGYLFEADETIHILAGRVRIQIDSGEVVELQPGDIASFPKGEHATWEILEPLREFFVLSGA